VISSSVALAIVRSLLSQKGQERRSVVMLEAYRERPAGGTGRSDRWG
jgi:hypothetical protein